MGMNWQLSFIKNLAILLILQLLQFSFYTLPATAADGYWLDQYNALLFIASMRLDAEFKEMRLKGATFLMVHADSLPDPILRLIAWRALHAGIQPVAWIQRPTKNNLQRLIAVPGYVALQVDDHFFADPAMDIFQLRKKISNKQLWCSFQPAQYSLNAARVCDRVDIQLYRQSCEQTVNAAYNLGIAGQPNTAIAVYHDGSIADQQRLACFQQQFKQIGNRLFVFKWKNPEYWLTPYTKRLSQLVARIRYGASVPRP